MPRTTAPLAALGIAFATWLGAARVGAQPLFHTIARGESLSVIASRYHVSVSALAERNHLTEANPLLRAGQRLRLPSHTVGGAPVTVDSAERPAPSRAAAPTPAAQPERRAERTPPSRSRGAVAARPEPRGGGRWGRPRRPGLVSLHRVATSENLSVLLRRPGRGAQGALRRFLRSTSGGSHAIDPRLMRALAAVSDHFGGRTVEVISGFRPFRRGQWTPHSNHNVGRAIDFRVVGVRNRALWDYCRTIPNVGCGFYPRSVFIHMDVRSESATWVDWSRPGQRPRYGRLDRAPADPTPSQNAAAAPAPAPTPAPAGADAELDDVVVEAPAVRDATPAPDDDQPDDVAPATAAP